MALETYEQVRPYARAIQEQTLARKMPPWFAAAQCGPFANNLSLTPQQIEIFSAWADAHAPAGDRREAPPPVRRARGWNIGTPDEIFAMPKAVPIPADGDVAYTYVIIPTHFKEDRWVRMSEIRPSNRAVVHHAVLYVREPSSSWLQGAPIGVPFTADDLTDDKLKRDAMWTTSDILLVYAPGSSPDKWPEGFAKLVPAGSDLVLQMHYTTQGKPGHGKPTQDQTSIGLRFSKDPPKKRVLTLQLTNDKFLIPPGDPDHRVEVHGSLPNDALLLSFFPHMHLRGKSFRYSVTEPGERSRIVLDVPHYDFYWQLSYRLENPLPLKAGTVLQAVATFDNSKNNPHNPDPDSAVTWGEQTWAEMMVGFFDVAVDPSMGKAQFFLRSGR